MGAIHWDMEGSRQNNGELNAKGNGKRNGSWACRGAYWALGRKIRLQQGNIL